MPESEHAQPVEGERKQQDETNRAKEQRQARDTSRPEEGRDYWRAGQQEDASAGDEGIDDPSMFVDDDPTLDDAIDARTEDDDVPNTAKRNDINDKTR